MATEHACFVCGTAPDGVFFETDDAPTHANLLPGSRDEAVAVPRASIRLALCATCGLVYNVAFEPERMRYIEGYETSLFASPAFRDYASDQARYLVETHGVRDKTVLEIGCGRGEFLRLVCEAGGNDGIGIDPSHAGTTEEFEGGGRMRILGEPYEEAWPDHPADLVLCRHVLEHLEDPIALLSTVASAAASRAGALVYFELPDARYTLAHGGIWDVIYEHCSYFTPAPLAFAFERAGLAPLRIGDTYGGQFLTIEARAAGVPSEADHSRALAQLARWVRTFGDTHSRTLARWKREFDDLRASGKRTMLWGAGSKGVTFLNAVDPDGEVVVAAVDGNERKQGRFLPGTGQPILAPNELASEPPDVVLVTNPLYADEIGRALSEMGVPAEVRLA